MTTRRIIVAGVRRLEEARSQKPEGRSRACIRVPLLCEQCGVEEHCRHGSGTQQKAEGWNRQKPEARRQKRTVCHCSVSRAEAESGRRVPLLSSSASARDAAAGSLLFDCSTAQLVSPKGRRAGFTITELIVSIGVLVMLIGMVSLVFSTASQSTRRAQSSSAAYRDIRNVVSAIRRDLEEVDPNNGLMCIVGAKIFAYHTPTDAASKRPLDPNASGPDSHRADLLMVLTDRMLQSYAHPQVPVTPPAMVVYGHADSGKLVYNSGAWTFDPLRTRPIEESGSGGQFVNETTPASEWHLARRTTVFPVTLIGDPFPPTPDHATLRTAEYDICDQSLGILTANLGSGRYLRNKEDNTWYFYNNGFAGVSAYKLMNPVTRDWHACNGGVYAYDDETWQDCAGYTVNSDVDGNETPETAFLMFYNPAATPADRRTLIDPAPPPEQAHRTAHFFLPRCSWFHVEYTYDDPREVLYDGSGSGIPITAPIRWHSVEPGEQIWWRGPLEAEPSTGPTTLDRWPRALRITFTLYTGSEGNAEPIQYTLIHTW